MNFSEQIKSIREQRGLTQEEMADKLAVTRQAVSNWENDRNLPDIEMLITMARTFGLSLDQLITGEKDMNNMTEKLIRDGSENRRAKTNMVSVIIGAVMFVIGIALIAIKAASVEYVDEAGVLHENFFLLPIAFLFFFGGFVTFLVTGIKNVFYAVKGEGGRKKFLCMTAVCAGVVLMCVGGALALAAANSGADTLLAGGICAGTGAATLIAGLCASLIKRKTEK